MRNKFAKRALALTCASTAIAGAFGMVGCGKKTPDTDQTLEVFCWDSWR